MLRIRNILLAVDFSPSSMEAISVAVDMADRFSARLHVLHARVLRRDPDSDRGSSKPVVLKEKLNKLLGDNALRERGYEPEDLDVIQNVEQDIEPAPAIINYAEQHEIDCVVIGTHGRRGIRRLLIGSVAEEVVRTAPCSVMTVRQLPDEGRFSPATIMVPVDFSEHAQFATAHAKHLAVKYDARLSIMHVVEEFLHPAFYGPGVQSIYDVEPDIEEKARDRLKSFYESTPGPNVDAEYLVETGRAGRSISDVAEKAGAGLLVMSTHGRTGMDHFLIGSVASRVVRSAPCPVLSVKPFGRSMLSNSNDDQ